MSARVGDVLGSGGSIGLYVKRACLMGRHAALLGNALTMSEDTFQLCSASGLCAYILQSCNWQHRAMFYCCFFGSLIVASSVSVANAA